MSDIKSTIRLHLDEALAQSKAVDVDEAAQRLTEHFPDLPIDKLKQAVLEVVVDAGGNASWGNRH